MKTTGGSTGKVLLLSKSLCRSVSMEKENEKRQEFHIAIVTAHGLKKSLRSIKLCLRARKCTCEVRVRSLAAINFFIKFEMYAMIVLQTSR